LSEKNIDDYYNLSQLSVLSDFVICFRYNLKSAANLKKKLEKHESFRIVSVFANTLSSRRNSCSLRDKGFIPDPRPVFLYVGRVAVEKHIEAFLTLDLPGTQYVVGDGPQFKRLMRAFPSVRFVGAKKGEALAKFYAAADVFVFPSRTDTFGIVMLEALVCGVPVAGYPVRGLVDIIKQGETGFFDEDLRRAALRALELDPKRCRAFAEQFSWKKSAEQFVHNLVPVTQTFIPAQGNSSRTYEIPDSI